MMVAVTVIMASLVLVLLSVYLSISLSFCLSPCYNIYLYSDGGSDGNHDQPSPGSTLCPADAEASEKTESNPEENSPGSALHRRKGKFYPNI